MNDYYEEAYGPTRDDAAVFAYDELAAEARAAGDTADAEKFEKLAADLRAKYGW